MKTQGTTLIRVEDRDIINGHLEIPKSITIISDNAFDDCNNLLKSVRGLGVQTIGSDFLRYNKTLSSITIPNVQTIGSDFLYYNKTLSSISLPKVQTIGSDFLCHNETLSSITLPNVQTIGSGFLFRNKNLSSIILPNVQTIGSDFLCHNETLSSITLPKVKTIGNHFLFYNETLSSISIPKVKTIGNHFLYFNKALSSIMFGKKKYEVVMADNSCFVKTKETKHRGVKVYEGYILKSITDGIEDKKECYLAQRGKFFAHGETPEKAVEDVRFKFRAEKLKKDPIKPDTMIDWRYYRAVTGACELGINEWKRANGIKAESVRAKELLPILKRTNAYGFESFSKLVTF